MSHAWAPVRITFDGGKIKSVNINLRKVKVESRVMFSYRQLNVSLRHMKHVLFLPLDVTPKQIC
jgi:hypothetical protein